METHVILTHAKSLDVFKEKAFFFEGRRVNLNRIELMATLGVYISKLSPTARFVLWHHLILNEDKKKVARLLNWEQNTKSYNSHKIGEIYIRALQKIDKYLRKAKLMEG